MKLSTSKAIGLTLLRLAFSILISFPALWVINTLGLGAFWYAAVIIGIVASLLTTLPLWDEAWSPVWVGVIYFAVSVMVLGFTLSEPVPKIPSIILELATLLVLFALSLIYPRKDAAANLAMAGVSVVLAVIVANVGAGMYLQSLNRPAEQPDQEPDADGAAPEDGGNEVVEAAGEEDPAPDEEEAPEPEPTEAPVEEEVEDPVEEEPQEEQPIPGWGYQEFLSDGGEVPWRNLTGFGPRINTVVRNYMYDANGNPVYDTTIEYNGKGMRGPEVDYEKPDDVYRILVIGDSFVEAIQVDFEDTFPAQLQDMLDDEEINGKRVEVIAMGRTGWGTLHEYIYYHHEGYKFNADLVVLTFYINDVADNFTIFFYPNINNTNFEFVFADNTVQLVDTNQQPLPPNQTRILYNGLPTWLQNTNLAKMAVRIGDPPIPVLTPGTVLERVHPQYYIYVTEPEVEGYPEAWERTEKGIALLANEVQANGGQLVIMPIFIGEEQIYNVSGWWPELVEGWQWDPNLPDEILGGIAERTGAELARTRPTYDAYAEEVNGEVFNLLFLPEDGHFNEVGHKLTAQALYDYLDESGIIK